MQHNMSINQPKCAVLISTFNRPDYLREAIQSVVDQTMTNWELLVMNDGGVEVAHVIQEFNDSRIRYFPDTENRGAACRFNFGLKNSRAEYITYLGDDDHFYPNHLAVLSKALDDNPDIALAYSDLYAVSCVKDEATGKRHVVDKKIVVSRDFNREFMFFYNHVLHVSLMHRKEAAFRVGCFDDQVKVLIEWSLNRRLCFIYDFLHVPVATGEYFMPVFKSDRISVVQRKDKDSYRHNFRLIKTALPDAPWPKIDKLSVIYPVSAWDESLKKLICDVVDAFDHPFRFILVNNDINRSREDCLATLGKVAEFRNLVILTPPEKLGDLESYRYGARQIEADYLFLLTSQFQGKTGSKRLFGGIEFLKNNKHCEGLKWDIEEEHKTVFDMLIPRKTFLKNSNVKKNRTQIKVQTVKQIVPSSFYFDALLTEAKRRLGQGNHQGAYETIHNALCIEKGAPGIQYMVEYLFRACLKLRHFDEIEKEVRTLIDSGYEPDNYLRLGQILQATNRPYEAVDAYQKSLIAYGLSEADLESGVFPFNFPKELSAFTTLIGLGECYFMLGQVNEAARFYHRAAKLRANSHKPFLGFARLFLAANQLDRAEVALSKIKDREGGKDPETHRVLGKLCERRKRMDLALKCYIKAYEADKADEKNIDPLYSTAAASGQWTVIQPLLEEFLSNNPEHLPAMTRLAMAYFQSRQLDQAQKWAERGLALDPTNSILQRIRQKSLQPSLTGPSPENLARELSGPPSC